MTQRRKKISQWCTTNQEHAQQFKEEYSQALNIYGPAVEAWNLCNRLFSNSVQIFPDITPDDRTVDIRIKYTGPSKDVKLQEVKHDGFNCEIISSTKTVSTQKLPIALGGSLVNVHCQRMAPTSETRGETNYSVLRRGTISVLTEGENLQLYFPEKWDPELPDSQVASLRKALSELSKRIDQVNGTLLSTTGEASQAKARLDILEPRVKRNEAVRYILWDSPTCPEGFRLLGNIGFIWQDGSYANNPFVKGTGPGAGWTYSHPSLCARN